MDVLKESERLLAKMDRAEKAQLLQWVVRDLGDAFPGIESTPDVLGGRRATHRPHPHSRLGARARQLSASEAEFLTAYPGLRVEYLANA